MRSEQASRDGPGKDWVREPDTRFLGGGVRTAKDAGCSHPSPQSSPSRGEGVLSPSCAIPSPASAPAASTPDHSPPPPRLRRLAPALRHPVRRDPRPPPVLRLLRHEIDARLARGATIAGPKLVILAGSNGPYSHRCATIAPLLHLPCVNAGVAVGIGLDYLFSALATAAASGRRRLSADGGSAVRPQPRGATRSGPDAAIMLRHDRATLAGLPPRRWLGALFSYDLRGALMALIETALVAGGFHDPRAAPIGESNAMGRPCRPHRGAGAGQAPQCSPPSSRTTPRAAQIRAGYGSVLIARFRRLGAARMACG